MQGGFLRPHSQYLHCLCHIRIAPGKAVDLQVASCPSILVTDLLRRSATAAPQTS